MIDLISIRNLIVKELYNYLQKPVIPINQANPKPAYPYIGYNITVPYTPQGGQGVYINKTIPNVTVKGDLYTSDQLTVSETSDIEGFSEEPTFLYDIEETLITQPTFTLSINAYSDDEVDSINLSMQALKWFEFDGYRVLKDNNIIVVETTAISSRNTLIVDDYERRQGFDVIFRVVSKNSKIIKTIETANLTGTTK